MCHPLLLPRRRCIGLFACRGHRQKDKSCSFRESRKETELTGPRLKTRYLQAEVCFFEDLKTLSAGTKSVFLLAAADVVTAFILQCKT